MTDPTPDFRTELARLVDLYYALGGNWSPHGYTDTWNDALASASAALATPPPKKNTKPGFINVCIEGLPPAPYEYWEDWLVDTIKNRTIQGVYIRALISGDFSFDKKEAATPPPAPPTDEERLADFTKWLAREMPPNTIIGDPLWWAPRIWRAVHKRWGQP